jgi:hypothetical protein
MKRDIRHYNSLLIRRYKDKPKKVIIGKVETPVNNDNNPPSHTEVHIGQVINRTKKLSKFSAMNSR